MREITLKLNSLTDEIEKIRANAGSEKGERDSLEKEYGTLKSENAKIANELRATLNKIDSLKSELDTAKQNYEEARRELERLRNEENENKAKIERYNIVLHSVEMPFNTSLTILYITNQQGFESQQSVKETKYFIHFFVNLG